MTHLLPWLTDHVRTAITRCGATGASVYVPTPWNSAAPGLLVHIGDAPPVPEMATLEAASAFAASAGELMGASTPARSGCTSVVPSAERAGCLLPIPLLATLWTRSSVAAVGTNGQELRRQSDRSGAPPIVGWLGLSFQGQPGDAVTALDWRSLLELASALASTYVCFYGILTDPITGLPGRADLNGTIRAELERAQAKGRPFSLVFLKLEQLDALNERHGRRTGDTVLREFLAIVHDALRRSDTVMRYGGSVFALPLPDVGADGAMVVARKVRAGIDKAAFFGGNITLRCAVGVASIDGPADAAVRPLDLLRRADQALAAAERTGGLEIVLWAPDGDVATIEHLDPLLGVFTGQSDKDYRNMRLLWHVLQALSSSSGSELARAVVDRLSTLFPVSRVALFEESAEGTLVLMTGLCRADHGRHEPWLATDLSADERQVLDDGRGAKDVVSREWEATTDHGDRVRQLGVVVPLAIDGRSLGALYLTGSAEALGIDASDAPVLTSVGAQLALALDRERLAEDQRVREQRERQVLRAELGRLRSVLTRSEFVFQSQPMNDLVATARRVAGTDATVLITGESGTGKEMLAETVHALSPRRERSLVVVDCGAIPASLIDSELFGRERGAYTGAERRSEGRLVQADGGTVFLDEIGELPLEVQAKLLRFVQEKSLTMVGGTRQQKVDVRIIAATNRSLEHEVRAGRFREDLFHRLNVVRLRVPPLRERPDDVAFLARHFLDAFGRQYGKSMNSFSSDALERLESHTWPGNVRELQNAILQAVVLGDGPILRARDLQLNDGEAALPSVEAAPTLSRATRAGASAAPAGGGSRPTYRVATRVLLARLQGEVARAAAPKQLAPPLGKWLARDLILSAFEESGLVAARAAALLQVPETTFSRRLRQAESEVATTRMPESWGIVRAAAVEWLRSSERPAGSVLDQADRLLLGLVASDDAVRAACLMGVTVPTLKRRLAEYQETLAAGTVEEVGSLAD
jgi:hydrogenase-4 transcriptional activator